MLWHRPGGELWGSIAVAAPGNPGLSGYYESISVMILVEDLLEVPESLEDVFSPAKPGDET